MRVLLLLLPGLLCAQSLKDFEKKVTEFTLANGMHFLVIERHEAPVVSFHTYVDAGSADDPGGRTGLAHMFEHMAFKGTPAIGTKNWTEEKKALAGSGAQQGSARRSAEGGRARSGSQRRHRKGRHSGRDERVRPHCGIERRRG